jgi:FixJ family two-component response regulator
VSKATPVTVITAYPSLGIELKAIEMGAVDFISKPFKAEDVLSRIRKALGEVSQEGEG